MLSREEELWRKRLLPISRLFHQMEISYPCRRLRFTAASPTEVSALVDCDGEIIEVTAKVIRHAEH